MTVKRELYLSQLRNFTGTPFIKILCGIRRCGKSSILELLKEELAASGVPEEDIIYINLELYGAEFSNPSGLSGEIKSRMKGRDKVFVLLDEVQLLDGWERVVNALFAGKKADIFITGSNSGLLSSELATLLSGRYVQFYIRPLSFAEYISFRKILGGTNIAGTEAVWEYLRVGGFPGIHYLKDMNSTLVYKAVADIFSAVVLKDVVQRNKLRNADLLERIIKFLLDNTGNMISANSMSVFFKNQKRKIGVDTILEYIAALERACVIEKARRWDIRGKKLLNIREKYYSADVSFIHALLGYDDRRLPGVLENIVYSELRRRGYDVFVGQYDDREIDFVALREGGRIYVQVTYLVNNDPLIIEREFGNLLKIKDQYPKYVVSLDEHRRGSVEGVRHVYLPEFLLMEDYLFPA
ncbi:MAG: ATP-binding protein [Treponema sp.]|jgi:predicted AAA+ superfamily ATPase|nr:ATP-binding protein [Treponema sp.]